MGSRVSTYALGDFDAHGGDNLFGGLEVLNVLDDLDVLDGFGGLASLGGLDGLEVCDQLLPNGLADPLGIELLEL